MVLIHQENRTNFKIIPIKKARATDNKVKAIFKFPGLLIRPSYSIYYLSANLLVGGVSNV